MTSATNRREHPRYAIHLGAYAISTQGDRYACVVENFCEGGLLVTFAPPINHARQWRTGDFIQVQFVDEAAGEVLYMANGQAVRVIDIGIGLRFTGDNEAVFNYLLASRQDQFITPRPVSRPPARHVELVAECRKMLDSYLQRVVDDFITTSVDSIGKSDDLTRANWRGVMDAQNKLRSGKEGLLAAYRQSVLDEFDGSGPGIQEEKSGQQEAELSLVSDEVFQDWLTMTALTTKLESHHDEMLVALDQRLGEILGRDLDRISNPLGPAILVQFFQEHFSALGLAEEMEDIVFNVFEVLMLSRYKPFLEQVNKYLLQHDILPVLKKDFRIVRQPGSVSPLAPVHDDSAAGGELPEHAESGVPVQGYPPVQNPYPAGPAAGFQVMADAASVPAGMGQPAAVGDIGSLAQGGAAAGITGAATPHAPAAETVYVSAGQTPFAAANELLGLTREALQSISARQPGGGGEGAPATIDISVPPVEAAAELYTPGELYSGLRTMQKQGVSLSQLRQQGSSLGVHLSELVGQFAGDGKRLPLAVQDKLDVTESLLCSIQTDQLVDKNLKQWFESIELPFVQMAVNHEEVLQDRAHPVHHLFNTLDQFFQILPPEQTQLRKELVDKASKALDALAEGEHADAMVELEEANSSIDKLYGEHAEQYRARVEEVIRQCESEPNQRQMMLEMLEDVDELLDFSEGRMIPRILLELFDLGWKNLLWRHMQNTGIDSDGYRAARATMEQLLARLLGKTFKGLKREWPNHRLVEEISKVLEKISRDKVRAVTLTSELITQLEEAKINPENVITQKKGSIAGLMKQAWEKEKQALKPAELTRKEWQRWLLRADAMEEGDLISHKIGKGDSEQKKLVWLDPEWGRYVFVDREGNKSLDTTLEDVAEQISRGLILLLEGWDRPLMDRATYSMLQTIHERLADQSNKDVLTGLLNRRGFTNILEELLVRAKKDESKNVLCCFDLDRFNVVNATCGHEAGDNLLISLADLLREKLGDKFVMARMSGDEFAILLENHDSGQAMQRTEKIHRIIKNHNFRCEDQEFAVDASFGLAEIKPGISTVRTLLATADSAVFAAKEAGRGRIEFYDAESDLFSKRHGIMEWVGRINKLFEAGLVQLKVQKISSLKNKFEPPRYEILLNVHDEDGKPVSLDQFVVSAEIYNRILDIDRWVVSKAFEWIQRNRGQLNHISALSINLSGQSINNEEFIGELVAKLERAEVPSHQICFEITETAAIANMEHAILQMRRLRKAGCQLALDDFGTGHASYSYLKSMPVDYLKIPGQFVRNISTNIFDYSVVKSVHEVAHALGKRTIAEYAESEIILDKLRKIGVDFGQGYAIEKPMPLEELKLGGK